VARPASAWEATQVTLQTTVFAYQKTSVTPDGSSDSESVSLTSFGLFGSGVGAGVGYTWDNVGFGVRTNVQNVSEGSESATALSLFPRLEYQANPGKSGAFVAALVGVTHLSLGDTSTTSFGFGGSLGAHGFIDPAVSIDPELTVIGSTGSESFSGGGSDASATQTGVQMLFTLGLSGWINSKHSSRFAPPPPEPVNAPPSAAPSGDEDEADKPLYASIHLPGHRELYLQASKDPARSSLIVRLSESRTEAALAACDDISVLASSGPLRMRVRRHGDHFVAGRLPLQAAELLASSPDAAISVCSVQWTLGQESREAIQAFLNDRRDLLDKTGDSDVPAGAPPGAPAPPAGPPSEPAPASAPSAAAPPANAPPTGTFAPTPAPTPNAPNAPPKK
jgi:hypothetical protein